MISGSRFTNIFGLTPAGDEEHAARVARAAAQAGFAVVLCWPGTKKPMCPLTARAVKQAGPRHPCGLSHASTDPAEIMKWMKRWPTANIGIELGRSRMIVVDVDTKTELDAFLADWSRATGKPEQHRSVTVASPGAQDAQGNWIHQDGGHFWFALPDGMELPRGLGVFRAPGGWVAMWADHQVLVPPSRRPEGPYRLLGQPEEAPCWLTDMIIQEVDSRRLRAERNLEQINRDDPLEQWSATTHWADLLDGWTATGLVDTCSCPIWTAPGPHASPKSATAHDVGCTRFDSSTGWGPLHVWTDNPPEYLVGRKTWTKVQFVAARDHDGDDRSAMVAVDIIRDVPVPEVMEIRFSRDPDHTDRTGGDAQVPTYELRGGPSQDQEKTDPFDDATFPGPDDPQTAETPQGRHMLVTRASEIRMRATRWLWLDDGAHWLSLGGLSLLGGREGIGKTTIAYGLAAQVTTGTLPGAFRGTGRSVVIAATEDAWEQTVVPRLAACGADLHKVFRVDVVHENGLMTGLQLPRDVPGLLELCQVEDVALVLLDPLLAVISGKLDTHKDAEVRQALEPLSRLAHDAQVSVLGLIHVNKSTGADLLTRLMASRAFSAVARQVLFCARDDEVPEADLVPVGETFMFGQPKNNLAQRVTHTLRYRIVGKQVGWDPELEEPVYGSLIEWAGRREERIDDVLTRQENVPKVTRQTAVDRAMKWVEDYLVEHGVTESAQVKRDAEKAGHGVRTVIRAANLLELVITVLPGTKNRTTWALQGNPVTTNTSVITNTTDTTVTTYPRSRDSSDRND